MTSPADWAAAPVAAAGPVAAGLVTIGQSPRDDVVPELLSRVADRVRVRLQVTVRGALDGLTDGEIAALAPQPGEPVLVTRLRDGRAVTLAEPRVMPLLQAAVDQVTRDGAAVVVLLCTGVAETGVRCPRPLLIPGPLLRGLVALSAPGARLGVLVPAHEQVRDAEASWAAAGGPGTRGAVVPGKSGTGGRQLHVLTASPYGPAYRLEAAAHRLAAWRPDLVVLDCLGFGERTQHIVADLTKVPVLLPRAVLAGALAAFA